MQAFPEQDANRFGRLPQREEGGFPGVCCAAAQQFGDDSV